MLCNESKMDCVVIPRDQLRACLILSVILLAGLRMLLQIVVPFAKYNWTVSTLVNSQIIDVLGIFLCVFRLK